MWSVYSGCAQWVWCVWESTGGENVWDGVHMMECCMGERVHKRWNCHAEGNTGRGMDEPMGMWW